MDSRYSDIWLCLLQELKKNNADYAYTLWYADLLLVDLTEKYSFFTFPSTVKRDILLGRHLDKVMVLLNEALGYETIPVVISLEELTAESKDDQVQFCIDLCKNGKLTSDEINKAHDGFLLNSFTKNNLLEPDHIVEPDYYDSLNSSEQIFNAENPPKQYHKEYTFDNFVVGSSNKFAHAACVAVASQPAEKYNPLFIHGASGLGKTHLLYAITNSILNNTPNASIIYVKGDEFTNQLIESIANHKTAAFKEKYRSCDVLLVDDIQFIAGKNAVQEEFFHTFNALFEDNKQIILASDRPARDINPLEERLKGRFEWGLMADIQPPDIELRIAILKRKAEDMDIQVSNDVLLFLAENIKNNIRQIEGAIKRLDAYSKLNGKSVSIELARKCISDFINIEENSITTEKIISSVCNFYNLNESDIKGRRKTSNIVTARFVTIYLLRTLTDKSSPEIGKLLDRDHATILNAESKISDRLKNDPQLEFEINTIIKDIKS